MRMMIVAAAGTTTCSRGTNMSSRSSSSSRFLRSSLLQKVVVLPVSSDTTRGRRKQLLSLSSTALSSFSSTSTSSGSSASVVRIIYEQERQRQQLQQASSSKQQQQQQQTQEQSLSEIFVLQSSSSSSSSVTADTDTTASTGSDSKDDSKDDDMYTTSNGISSSTGSTIGKLVTTTTTTTTTMIKDIMELSKFRLSALVVATSSAGFLAAGTSAATTATTAAAGTASSGSTIAACCLGTALCSSSASTFNQIFEIDRDRLMKRTRLRPLVKGTVSVGEATALATLTGMGGAATLCLGTDPVTTALGVGNIVLYSGLYTYMKPRSELNTWIGAIVGAIPPIMGWTAAGGNVTDPESIVLGSMLYLWQMPHFFALAYMHRADYARGHFQMVPVNEIAEGNYDRTASLITRYTWYLSTIPVAAYALDVTSSMFPLEGILLNGYALHVAHKFDKERTNANARKVFMTSLWYLPTLMTLFILHSKTWRNTNDDDHLVDQTNNDLLLTKYHEFIQALRPKGRDLCLHEIVTHGNDLEFMEGGGGEERCPFTSKGREHAVEVINTEILKERTNNQGNNL